MLQMLTLHMVLFCTFLDLLISLVLILASMLYGLKHTHTKNKIKIEREIRHMLG